MPKYTKHVSLNDQKNITDCIKYYESHNITQSMCAIKFGITLIVFQYYYKKFKTSHSQLFRNLEPVNFAGGANIPIVNVVDPKPKIKEVAIMRPVRVKSAKEEKYANYFKGDLTECNEGENNANANVKNEDVKNGMKDNKSCISNNEIKNNKNVISNDFNIKDKKYVPITGAKEYKPPIKI